MARSIDQLAASPGRNLAASQRKKLKTSQIKAIEEIRERRTNGGFGAYDDMRRLATAAGYTVQVNGREHAEVCFEGSKVIGSSGYPLVFPRSKKKKMPVHIYKRFLKDILSDFERRYGSYSPKE